MAARVQYDEEQLADFCRRNHIRKLSFFGSILRDDFSPESDIDVLVEFLPGRTPGFAFFEMQEELSKLLDRRVDLNTAADLSRYYRDDVLAEAEPQYVEA